MIAKHHIPDEIGALSPSQEIGAFEAVWSQGITSFKQIADKRKTSKSGLLSELVDYKESLKFYNLAKELLYQKGIKHFGVRIDGTIDYPDRLHDAVYPVALLYYQGNWDLVYKRGVSVVGTRNPSANGIKRARKLVRELVAQNFTIFSGLAKGIDTIAHKTAIEQHGETVAVVGTPLWKYYPTENTELQKLIAKKYLLISQVPVVSYKDTGINITRTFFPERNKTMSALTEATIVVEAGETSGTLVQAKFALKQGRKVFILNNNFENPKLTWPAKLEKAGAIRVFSTEDILNQLTHE